MLVIISIRLRCKTPLYTTLNAPKPYLCKHVESAPSKDRQQRHNPKDGERRIRVRYERACSCILPCWRRERRLARHLGQPAIVGNRGRSRRAADLGGHCRGRHGERCWQGHGRQHGADAWEAGAGDLLDVGRSAVEVGLRHGDDLVVEVVDDVGGAEEAVAEDDAAVGGLVDAELAGGGSVLEGETGERGDELAEGDVDLRAAVAAESEDVGGGCLA